MDCYGIDLPFNCINVFVIPYFDKRTGGLDHLLFGSLGMKEMLTHQKKRILIRKTDGYEVRSISDLSYCTVAGDHVSMAFADGSRHELKRSLTFVEQALDSPYMIRIHPSHLINISHAKYYLNKGQNIVVMDDEEELDVSKSNRSKIFNCMKRL